MLRASQNIHSGRYRDDAVRVPPGAVFLSKPYQRRQLLAVLALVRGATATAE
ncbi:MULTISPECIES: hypothetical protein [Luteibacter]|uniref:hypothetical protein n=1 Tax=Luteibacter TaxID=242605 RepID=UPI000B12CF1D|nr:MULTISPECIES: hypothetical protein [unclassified Luteibacter]